jgi:hypothetical protein
LNHAEAFLFQHVKAQRGCPGASSSICEESKYRLLRNRDLDRWRFKTFLGLHVEKLELERLLRREVGEDVKWSLSRKRTAESKTSNRDLKDLRLQGIVLLLTQ